MEVLISLLIFFFFFFFFTFLSFLLSLIYTTEGFGCSLPRKKFCTILSFYVSCSLADRWDTTVDFTTSLLHSLRFSAIFHSRPVHSLMLSSHRFLCLPLRLPPWTVPCTDVRQSRNNNRLLLRSLNSCTEIEAEDQMCWFTQSQCTDTGPTSSTNDCVMSGTWLSSHWSTIFFFFLSHWYKISSQDCLLMFCLFHKQHYEIRLDSLLGMVSCRIDRISNHRPEDGMGQAVTV